MQTIEEIMSASPVIPVIVIQDIDDAVPLAQALLTGGLKVLEITLRTDAGLEAIRRIKRALPEVIVGAGTVLTPEDMSKAVDAGCQFLVSPGSTPSLIDAALKRRVPLLPGVMSPSEAMVLLEKGISHMKFFPAEAAGGITMLKSIHGPLPSIRFCPTGGINEVTAPEYLLLDNVLCVGGSWMMERAALEARNWAAIEAGARAAAQLRRKR